MTEEKLRQLLEQPPGDHLDFLLMERDYKVPNLFATICAFLNSAGGTIFVGVSREKKYQNLSPEQINFCRTDTSQKLLKYAAFLKPTYSLPMGEAIIYGNRLLWIKVERSSYLHKSEDKIYDRVGTENKWIYEEREIAAMYDRKRHLYSESEIIPYLSESDLDLTLLDKARTLASRVDSSHKWLSMTNEEILRGSMLRLRDFHTRNEGLTLAAALLLGKDETIGSLVPSYKLDIIVRKDNLDRWDDRKIFRTNLIDTRDAALTFLKGHLPTAFFQEGDIRKDLRDLIFREVVGNVIVHREYRNDLSTEIIIYKDRVEATNPNKVIFRGPLDLTNFNPYPKNPNIRRFFNELGWTDEAGSGVRNVTKYLRIYANGAIPEFFENDVFKTTIPLNVSILGDRLLILTNLLDITEESLGAKRVSELKNLPISNDLYNIESDYDFVYAFMGTLAQNEVNLSNINFLKNKEIEANELKKEGTWSEKGGNLLKKRGAVMLKVLMGLIIKMTLEEAMKFAGYGSKESFRDSYIKVLRDNDLVDLTNPTNPHDPKQKYQITDRGKKLIGGIIIKIF